MFNPSVTSVLIEYLTDHEVFLKLSMLSKNIGQSIHNLKSASKIWRDKYLREFISVKDEAKYNSSEEGREQFMKNFADNLVNEEEPTPYFNFYVRSVTK